MKKQNKNFIYNSIFQIFNIILPLITIPYISRVLGVDNIGIYSYTYSIVNYFILASMLGINNYGSREIAKLTQNKEKMSKKFWSIYYLQFFLSCIMIIIYFLMVLIFNFEYKNIMLIQLIFLVATMLDISWLYFGIEKFKVTVTRNITIKLLSLIFIFLLVKNSNDLWIYTIIMACSTLFSQLYLWLIIRKEIIFCKVSIKDVFSNFRECLILFIPIVAYSIYRITDKTMIGAIVGTTELGFYENAERVINIPLSFIAALGTVMLPRMSAIGNNKKEFDENIKSSFMLTCFLLLPMAVGLFIVSYDFTILFFGEAFEKSSLLIKCLVCTFLFSGFTSVIRTNYLIPNNKNNIYISSTILGAIINLIMNIIFIRKYGAIGACIGTITVEFFIMIYQVIFTKSNIEYKDILTSLLPFCLSSVIMGIIIYSIGLFIDNMIIRFIVQITVGSLFYIIYNYKYILYDFFAIKKGSSKKTIINN